MQFTDLFYGYVIDWSFYPLTVVGEPERVAGKRTWRVKVYNNVTGTTWFEGFPEDRMKACARPADFGPHPTAEEFYAEKARLADIERAKKQREFDERIAGYDRSIARFDAQLESVRAARARREAIEEGYRLLHEDAF